MIRTTGLLIVGALALAGCSTVTYYAQAIGGQLNILARAEPIDEILDATPVHRAPPEAATLRSRLTTVLEIREFATSRLALPDNGSYREYVELDRDAVAWNVVVAPELSLSPRRWCFPVIGCVPYRGFFSLDRAREFADEQRRAGFDVRVATVAGYSTLGWFRDPIVSTQLRRNDIDLAALIFHELAHQKLYISNDAAFNESFATVVEKQGVQAWLGMQGSPERFGEWEISHRMQLDFVRFLGIYRERLKAVYASTEPDEARRLGKRKIYSELRDAYPAWRTRWDNNSRYDGWFADRINNAHLAGIDLYFRHVPAFEELFRRSGYDFARFYRAAGEIGRKQQAEREQLLAGLAGNSTVMPGKEKAAGTSAASRVLE